MKLLAGLLSVLVGASAFASATRTLDGQQITNGAAVLTIPTTTDTLAGIAATQTLTNKTISGASNTFSNIPVSAIATGTALGVNAGGTGLTSGTSGGILGFTASGTIASSGALTANQLIIGGGAGATPSTLAAGSQYQSLVMGASAPSYGAVPLNQGAAVSGQLGVANGGTGASTLTSGSVLVGNGTSAVSLVAPGTSGNVLTSNGSTWTSSAASSPAPSLNGGSGSAAAVTAAGGVVLSSITYSNLAWIAGSGGPVTVTKTPSVTAGTADGQRLVIIGTSATNTVTLQDQANLASSGLSLNGNWIGSKDSGLTLHWDATQSLWVEDSRR